MARGRSFGLNRSMNRTIALFLLLTPVYAGAAFTRGAARLLVPSAAVSGLMRPTRGVALYTSAAGRLVPVSAGVLPAQALLPELAAEVREVLLPESILDRLAVAEQAIAGALGRDGAEAAGPRLGELFDASRRGEGATWLDAPGQAADGERAVFEANPEGVVEQYAKLREYVSKLEPDGMVGGWLYSKKVGKVEVLWRLAERPGDLEVIRVYLERPGEEPGFSLSYYRGRHMEEGRDVVRRIIGFLPQPWRADTADAETGEYIGLQGTALLELDAEELRVLRDWGVVAPAPKAS